MHRRGLLSPAPGGYLVERPELLNRLLAAYACVLHQTSGGRLVPDTRTPVDSRRLAAPSLGAETQHALATSLPGVVAPNLSTDIRRFIDFRKDDKNERHRRNYIEELTNFWHKCSVGGAQHADAQLLTKVSKDVVAAAHAYERRIPSEELASFGLGSTGVVLPLMAGHPLPILVGAIASVFGMCIPIAVRNGAPKYIVRATKTGLIAPVATN